MENPYAHVIKELEGEISRIRQAILVLEQRAPSASGQVAAPVQVSVALPEITNVKAVDQVLGASKEPLTVKQIIQHAATFGKKLNINSARWVLHAGEKAGKYRKTQKDRLNLYTVLGEQVEMGEG